MKSPWEKRISGCEPSPLFSFAVRQICYSRFVDCPQLIRLAEAGGLRILLGAEPAIRLRHRRVAGASLQVIDADIAGDAGAHGELALDAAARRHRGILGEQHRADFAILVGPAGVAQQRAVLAAQPEFLGGNKAAFPESAPIVLSRRLRRP